MIAGAPMIPFRTVSSRVLGVALLLVVLRSVIFVFFEQAHFDSDQAVFGLMTKHLAEGRAFPLFMYGQKYLLAVSVYLAVPFVWAFGPSVGALKVVLLVVNLVVTILLYVLLRRDARLAPLAASVAMVFFVVPPVVTSSRLVEFQGATIEPFLWILLLWLMRSRPALLGVVGAVGVLNREFVAYGLVALLILDGRSRRGTLISGPVFAATTLMVRWVARTFSSNYFGTGTPFGWHFDLARLGWLFTENLPDIFGLRRLVLADFNIGSRLSEGSWLSGISLLCALALALWRLVRLRVAHPPGASGFPAYLCLVGLCSMGAYVCFAPAVADPMLIRYTLLALLLPCGIFALYFARETRRVPMVLVIACLALWALQNARSHARLYAEYLTRRPINSYRLLVDYLEQEHLGVGRGPYWTAYHLTFLSGERVITAADDTERIPAYRDLYRTAGRRFRIQEGSCRASGNTVIRWCVTAGDGSEDPATSDLIDIGGEGPKR